MFRRLALLCFLELGTLQLSNRRLSSVEFTGELREEARQVRVSVFFTDQMT